jgi:lipopolysaccharide export LptBFGC system permease protein LptF
MCRRKLNIVVPVMSVIIASIQPALAGAQVPAPVIGAGLPAIVILAGGYWLIRKLREPR